VALVRSELGEAARGAPVYGGTNVLFTELNRFRPEFGTPEGIAWPLNATVHASDDTSVIETPAMHGETVRSARAFCGALPLAVTPVTFNQRFNPFATGPEPEPEPCFRQCAPPVQPAPSRLDAGERQHLAGSHGSGSGSGPVAKGLKRWLKVTGVTASAGHHRTRAPSGPFRRASPASR